MSQEQKTQNASLDITVYDSQSRPLFEVRRLANGKDQWIFHRYTNMLDGERNIVKKMHSFMTGRDSMATVWDHGKEIKLEGSIDDFLNLEDKNSDLCG